MDLRASVCPHCRKNVLVDVATVGPVSDGRLRYLAARNLAEKNVGLPLAELLDRLKRGGSLLRGVTLEVATTALETLSHAGVQAVSGPSDEKPEGVRTRMPWKLVTVVAGVGVVALALGVFWMRRGAIGFGALSPRAIAARALDSVVTVRCSGRLGSGFFIREHQIVTNEHVTCGADVKLEIVTTKDTKGTGRVVKASKRFDLALLEVEGIEGKPLDVASAGSLAAGDSVMVIGNPIGLESTFHVGTVSNARRVLLDVSYLQLDARINPGNSGGPALDDEGRVVAVVSMKHDEADGIGLALPIDYLYEGSSPLVEPPSTHPSPGFAAMLSRVHDETKKLEKEREEVGIQLVKAIPRPPARVGAIVVTMSDSLPKASLDFRLESQGDRCKVSAPTEWRRSTTDDPFATRAQEFMRERGFGEVYVGSADLDFSNCPKALKPGAALVLCEGDESKNRLEL